MTQPIPTLLTSGNAGATDTPATASVSPTANRHVFVTFSCRFSAVQSSESLISVAGCNLTWTKVAETLQDAGGSSDRTTVTYVGRGASPTPGAITITSTATVVASTWVVAEAQNCLFNSSVLDCISNLTLGQDPASGGGGSPPSGVTITGTPNPANDLTMTMFGTMDDTDTVVAPTGYATLGSAAGAETQSFFFYDTDALAAASVGWTEPPLNRSWSQQSFILLGTVDAPASQATDIGSTRNRPGRGPYSQGQYFRPSIDAFATAVNNSIAVPLATITLAANAPTVTSAANNVISVPVASITLDGKVPTVSATANNLIAVPAGSITLDAFAPTVTLTANQTVTVPVASLTLDALTPSVNATANSLIAIPLATMSLNAIAPSVQSTGPNVIYVPLAAISITVYAPNVVNSTPNDQASGGYSFWPDYELIQRQRRQRRKQIEEAEAATQQLQDETDREIARLLHEQEQKDADRADLARLQKLADQYATSATDLPKVARIAILNAQDARTRNSLEQMQRVIEQIEEEELLAINQVLLLLDE